MLTGHTLTDNTLFSLLMLSMAMPMAMHLLGFRAGLRFLRAKGLVRRNYAGAEVPTAGGLLLLVYMTATFALVTSLMLMIDVYYIDVRDSVFFVCSSVVMALWGLQDDRSQEKETKGFRGHFGTLLSEQRMTSGLLKAWGGASTAFITSLALSDGFVEVVVNTTLLALSTNLINLFDVRPARAIKVFWLMIVTLMVATPLLFSYLAWLHALSVLSATVLFFGPDARGKVMLGDTGSNYLGFVAGFALMVTLSVEAKVGIAVLFLALHVVAERVSFSHVIQAVPLLNRLDRWGRSI